MRRIACILLLFFSFLQHSKSQQFGGNPASLKWRQINTDTARIIFPAGLDSTANRVAAVIHELQRSHNATIGKTLRKVNIVLQNQTTISNAYVGLAPYRSEFYLFAPQNNFQLGTLGWSDNLSIHEYRHVQQYSNFNIGLSKVASIILGQEGQAVANAAAVPDWFFEGDAVFSETSLSNNGRGRLPFFFKNYQSLFYSNKHYSYMKLRNGSYRHFVPDHYDLGYLLVAYGREKYGADIWRKITQDAAAFKPLLYPLQGALRRHTGISYEQFVKDAFQFYQSQWQQEKVPDVRWRTYKHDNYVVDYQYPYPSVKYNTIALESGYRQRPRFVAIDAKGSVRKIAVKDISNDDYFSCNNDKIVYARLHPDARWSYRQYSDVVLVDVATRNQQTIVKHSRYFSPDISFSGNRIAAVEMTMDQRSNLVVMDNRGTVIYKRSGGTSVFTYPKFSADDRYLYVMVKDDKGMMAMQKIDFKNSTAQPETILPFADRIIGLPVVQNDTILFSASYNGRDEIWAYVEHGKALYRVAGYPTGFYQAFTKGDNLYASAFTANGYQIAQLPTPASQWQKVDVNENTLPDLYAVKALQQEDSATLNRVPPRQFATSKYSKLTHPFNFHSWRPFYDEPELSFSVYGQNILNTIQTEISYTYNRNEGSHQVGGNLIYGGWYVQPYAGISHTWDRTVRLNADTSLRYREFNANVGLQLPLNFTSGKQYRYLTPSFSFNNQQVRGTPLGRRQVRDYNFNFLQGRLVYSGQIQRATQQIYPHWAQTLVLQYRSALNNVTARQFLATGSLYLPGLHTNHSMVLNAAFQGRDTANQYYFGNSFPISRGYNQINFPRMWKVGGSYHFPIAYPDWGFANLVYFRRVRGAAFYDQSWVRSLRFQTTYSLRSTGMEIYFDTRWWNQQDVTFGIRYSRLIDNDLLGLGTNQFQIILPVNLFSYQ